MSCVTTATATEFSTATSLAVSTSFSQSVTTLTSLSPTTIVTTSCSGVAVPDRGSAPATSCVPFTTVSTVTGVAESVVQVPVAVTVTLTSPVATATLFTTSCATTTTVSSTTTLPGGSVSTTDVTSTLTAAPTTTSSSGSHHSSHIGAIVGGAVGGSVGLALLILLLLCAFRRSRRHDFDYDDSDVLAPQMVHRHRNGEIDMLDSEPRPYPYVYGTSPYTPYDVPAPPNAALARSATYPHHIMGDPSAPPAAVERSASDNGGVLGTFDMNERARANYRPPLRVANPPNNAGIGLRDVKDPALFGMTPAPVPPHTMDGGSGDAHLPNPYVHRDGGIPAYPIPPATHDLHSISRVPPPVYTEE